MTKRFTYEKHKVKDNLTGEFHSSNRVSVNVLNELYDENQKLKHALSRPIIEAFSLKDMAPEMSNDLRIANLINHAMIQFIKSKGHSLEEVTRFVKEEL